MGQDQRRTRDTCPCSFLPLPSDIVFGSRVQEPTARHSSLPLALLHPTPAPPTWPEPTHEEGGGQDRGSLEGWRAMGTGPSSAAPLHPQYLPGALFVHLEIKACVYGP